MYCVFQIADKVEQVKVVQERLNKTWENKKEYHDQLYDFHIFLRDAGQLDNTCSSQEVNITVRVTVQSRTILIVGIGKESVFVL